MITTARDASHSYYALNVGFELSPGKTDLGTVYAVSAETGATTWLYEQRTSTTSVVATGGGLLFLGDTGGGFLALDQANGEGALARGTRLTRYRVPDYLRGGRTPVRGGEYRILGNHREFSPHDAGGEAEFREQPVRVRVAEIIASHPRLQG